MVRYLKNLLVHSVIFLFGYGIMRAFGIHPDFWEIFAVGLATLMASDIADKFYPKDKED